MKNKTVLLFGVIFAMLALFGSCAIEEKQAPEIQAFALSEFVQTDLVVDNETPLEEVLTNEYPLSLLETFFGRHATQGAGMLSDMDAVIKHSMVEVHMNFPIQCLRYHNNVHYSVYKVEEGGYYYVFWTVPLANSQNSDQSISVASSVYISRLPSVSEFRWVIKNHTTGEKILEIDPSMEIDFLASSVRSYSRLDDGRIVLISYRYTNFEKLSDLIVDGIWIYPPRTIDSAISAIFDADLP